jgi:hypothetical protein
MQDGRIAPVLILVPIVWSKQQQIQGLLLQIVHEYRKLSTRNPGYLMATISSQLQ